MAQHSDEARRLIDEAIDRVLASVAGTSGAHEDGTSSSNQDGAGTSSTTPQYRLPDLENLSEDYWFWDKKLSPQIVESEVQFHGQTVVFLEDNFVASEAPVIRGSKALTEHTIAYWKIILPHVYNTATFIGIGTIGSKLRFSSRGSHTYSAGANNDIYGITPDGKLHTKSGLVAFCPQFQQYSELHTIEVLFDGPHRKLSFAINQGQMITMEEEIDTSLTLFPLVSSLNTRSVIIVCEQKCRQDPQPLLNHCISKILARIPEKKVITNLPLPDHMLNLLMSRAHNTPDAIINFDLTEFTEFMSVYPDNEKVTHRLSEPTYIYDLPWKILIMPRLSAESSGGNGPSPAKKPKTELSEKTLGFFIQCNSESKESTWRCTATAVLCVRSQKSGVKNYTRHIAHTFCKDEDDWGYSRFLSAEYLANPENGYIKDNTIRLSVQIWAQPPFDINRR